MALYTDTYHVLYGFYALLYNTQPYTAPLYVPPDYNQHQIAWKNRVHQFPLCNILYKGVVEAVVGHGGKVKLQQNVVT
jgi:hypothetical protein